MRPTSCLLQLNFIHRLHNVIMYQVLPMCCRKPTAALRPRITRWNGKRVLYGSVNASDDERKMTDERMTTYAWMKLSDGCKVRWKLFLAIGNNGIIPWYVKLCRLLITLSLIIVLHDIAPWISSYLSITIAGRHAEECNYRIMNNKQAVKLCSGGNDMKIYIIFI